MSRLPPAGAVEQGPEAIELLAADLLGAEEVGEEGRERPPRETLGEAHELLAREVLPGHRGGEQVHVEPAIPDHASLFLALHLEHFAVFNQARDTVKDSQVAVSSARIGERLDSSV